jgi:sirohydrochlorin cobaltochelatase
MLDNPGHQSIHYCDDLLSKLSERNFTCSLEGAWPFKLLKNEMVRRIKQLHESEDKPVINLIPLLLVSGNHFVNDLKEIKEMLSDDADVKVAEPIQGDKFCMLDMPELLHVVDKQVKEGLVRLGAPEGER